MDRMRAWGILLTYAQIKIDEKIKNMTPEEKLEMENFVKQKIKEHLQEDESKKS